MLNSPLADDFRMRDMGFLIVMANQLRMKKRVADLDPAVLAMAFDRTPVVLEDTAWPESDVLTPEQRAFVHRAAKKGLNVDFRPSKRAAIK